MKVKVNFNDFKSAIKKLNKVKDIKALEVNNIHVITDNNSIKLTKQNLSETLQATICASAEENGQIIIPESTIKLISNIKKNGELEITNEYLKLNKKTIKFRNIDLEKYPKVKFRADIKAFEVSNKELNRLLEVSYAVSKEEIRPILTGVNIKGSNFATVDGYRLSIRHSDEFVSDLNVTFNQDLLKILLSLIDKKSDDKIQVFTNKENTYIRFKFDDFEIESKLLEGTFINYESIIPEQGDATTITKIKDDEVLDKIQLINKLNKDKIITVLDIKDDRINLEAKDTENIIEDDLNGDIEGEDVKIAFNNKYLEDGFKLYKNDEFKMYFKKAISPVVITNDYKNLELILPIRLPM